MAVSVDGLHVELVTARTSDSVLLHGALVVPEQPRGAILGVHGAWGNFYATPAARLLVDAPVRGFAALTMNARGHDLGSLGDGEPCIGFIRDRLADAPADFEAAVRLLSDRGLDRLVVVAHSYGANRAAYWLTSSGATAAQGLVLLSPAPALQAAAEWFVEGAVEHHLALAAAAVAAGHPEQLIVLASRAPVPMVAEACTVLDTWAPDTLADARRHMPSVAAPVLVVVGRREPAAYRERAEVVAALCRDSELVVLDDDHYYQRDPPAMSATVLDWIERRGVLSESDRAPESDSTKGRADA
jgi:hypothetical protein